MHRDIKPENVGLYEENILVLFDLGMARFYTNEEGKVREPRCLCGMRGTDEWASLSAELGRDQVLKSHFKYFSVFSTSQFQL